MANPLQRQEKGVRPIFYCLIVTTKQSFTLLSASQFEKTYLRHIFLCKLGNKLPPLSV
ncbi:primosome assembly protein PriA [Yersinia pestis]|nr:primosome assembly protein PriA [Yersinia pestis]